MAGSDKSHCVFRYRNGSSTDMLCWRRSDAGFAQHAFGAFICSPGLLKARSHRGVAGEEQRVRRVSASGWGRWLRAEPQQGCGSPHRLSKEISFLKQLIFHLFTVSLQGTGFGAGPGR